MTVLQAMREPVTLQSLICFVAGLGIGIGAIAIQTKGASPVAPLCQEASHAE